MKPIALTLTGTLRATFAAALLTAASFAVIAQDDATTRATKAVDQLTAQTVEAAEDLAAQQSPTGRTPKKNPGEKSDHEKLTELLGIGLGCIAMVMGIGIAFFAIWVDHRKRRDLLTLCHQERMAALEKGLELPPFPAELSEWGGSPKQSFPGTGLKPGLMWLAVGIGLWLFLSSKNRGFLHPSVGAIPGAVGVAHLVYHALEGRKRAPGKSTSTL